MSNIFSGVWAAIERIFGNGPPAAVPPVAPVDTPMPAPPVAPVAEPVVTKPVPPAPAPVSPPIVTGGFKPLVYGIGLMNDPNRVVNPAAPMQWGMIVPQGTTLADFDFVVANIYGDRTFLLDSAGNLTVDLSDLNKIIANAGGKPVKVRCFFAACAPAHMKTLGNTAPLTIASAQEGRHPDAGLPATNTIGRTWTAEYAAAVQQCMDLLAAQIDSNPRIFAISITGLSMKTGDEQMNIASNSAAALLAAGYTDIGMQNAIAASPGLFSAFKRTRLSMDFAPMNTIQPGSAATTPWMVNLLNKWRAADPLNIISNQGYRAGLPAGAQSTILAAIKAAGGPSQAQLDGAQYVTPTDLDFVLSNGVNILEIWGNAKGLTPAYVAQISARAKANALQ